MTGWLIRIVKDEHIMSFHEVKEVVAVFVSALVAKDRVFCVEIAQND